LTIESNSPAEKHQAASPAIKSDRGYFRKLASSGIDDMKLYSVVSIHCLTVIALLLFVPTVYSQQHTASTANEQVAEIARAWNLRTSKLKSIEITADLDEKTLGTDAPPSRPGSPFAEGKSVRDQHAKVKLEFLLSGKKTKLVRHSDRVFNGKSDAEYVSQLLMLSFDGKSNFQLIDQATRIPMGEIDKSRKAISRFNVHIDFVAIYLWHHPTKVIEAAAWDCAGMSTDGTVHEIDGISCLRLDIPRKGNKAWTSVLYVNPVREYLPVKWQTFFRDRPMKTFTIGYRENATKEFVIKNWELVDCDEVGIVESIRKGTVTSSTLNGPIEDSRFAIKFPVGTHIIEKDGAVKKFYIQDKERLVPIKPEEYARRKRTISFHGPSPRSGDQV
jgi:hypothetical protein